MATKKQSRSLAQLRRITLDEWKRPIGAAAYARGVSACLQNGRDLIDDSLTLLEAGRSARAVVLALLALEEGDKIKRLVRIALFTDRKQVEREWVAFRDHKPKLASALSILTHGDFSLASDHVTPKKGHLKPGDAWIAEFPRLAQRLKLRCLYATRLRDGTWTSPTRMVPRVVAEGIIAGVLLFSSVTTTLVLAVDMLIGGQVEESPGFERPDLSEGTPRAKRWVRWRLGKAGQRWGQRELAKHIEWLEQAQERNRRVSARSRRSRAKKKRK